MGVVMLILQIISIVGVTLLGIAGVIFIYEEYYRRVK
jgi:hypothetical protein